MYIRAGFSLYDICLRIFLHSSLRLLVWATISRIKWDMNEFFSKWRIIDEITKTVFTKLCVTVVYAISIQRYHLTLILETIECIGQNV